MAGAARQDIVDVAGGGDEALSQLAAESTTSLLDLRMPETNGVVVLKRRGHPARAEGRRGLGGGRHAHQSALPGARRGRFRRRSSWRAVARRRTPAAPPGGAAGRTLRFGASRSTSTSARSTRTAAVADQPRVPPAPLPGRARRCAAVQPRGAARRGQDAPTSHQRGRRQRAACATARRRAIDTVRNVGYRLVV